MFLLINKPSNITSHDVINQLRKITGIKKIGHAGTLDPFATGLLIIAINRQSTKKLNQFVKLDKVYQATLQLGAVSDTYDLTGEIQPATNDLRLAPSGLTTYEIKTVLKKFIGEQLQTPPAFSAKKINGKRSYQFARQGIQIKLKPQKITIYTIRLNKFLITNHQLLITIHCSSGTYIRALGHDIGQALGCGAYLTKLTRTQIGEYKLKDAVNLNQLTSQNWQHLTYD